MHINKHHFDDLRPVLLQLLDAGMRQAEIAREVGLSRATINFVVRKKDTPWMPGYEAGRRLMELAKRRKSKETTHA